MVCLEVLALVTDALARHLEQMPDRAVCVIDLELRLFRPRHCQLVQDSLALGENIETELNLLLFINIADIEITVLRYAVQNQPVKECE